MTTFTDPTPDDIDQLARQCLAVDRYTREVCGAGFQATEVGLEQLQQVIDSAAIAADQTWELQSLGVALGRILMTTIDGLDWAIIEDEYGRDPTVRYRKTSLSLDVLTMISKRIERGERVDVRELFDGVRRRTEELRDEVDRPDGAP